MAVPHQEMTIHLSSLFSLDRYSLFVIQHCFCLFTFQSSTCFGTVMIGRYDQSAISLEPVVIYVCVCVWKVLNLLDIYPDITKLKPKRNK